MQTMTRNASERLATVYATIAEHGRVTKTHIRQIAGLSYTPEHEVSVLLQRGMIVQLPAINGVCELTWMTVRQAKAAGLV